MKLFAATTNRSGRIFSKKVFASHMCTLFLLPLLFGIVVDSTKAASTADWAKDGAISGTARSAASAPEDPLAPGRRSPVGHVSSPEAEAAYQKAVDYEAAGKTGKALKHYETAAGLGYPRAQFNLGNHYYEGKIVPRDIDRAMELFTAAARGGHTRAQFNLASILEKGRMVPKDEPQARHWYQAAAGAGFARAASQLGVMWEEGRGGDVDEEQAVVYYEQGAAADEPSALNNLGRLSLLGKGLPRREDAAIAYFKKAAGLGFAPAQVSLGHICEGQEKHAEAKDWYLKAAKSKHDKAYYFLGVLYEDGLGTAKDPKQAHELYRLAAPVSDGVNYTALQLAAKDGRLDAVKIMLEAGADVEAGNRDGMTALKLAIKYSHKSTVEYLQAIYDAHNIMGKKLEQRFKEQAEAIAALQDLLHRSSAGHDADIASLRGKVDSTAASSTAAFTAVWSDMGRIASASATGIGALDRKVDATAASSEAATAALGSRTDATFAAHASAISGVRGDMGSMAAAHAADIGGLRGDMGRTAASSASTIAALEHRMRGLETTGTGATDDMRAKLAILMEQYDQEQAEERERLAIRSKENLRAFYRQFQIKLEGMFLAYKVLNTGLITREKDTTDKVAGVISGAGAAAEMLGKALELAGNLVPIPFINVGIKVAGWLTKTAVSKGLEYAGKGLEKYHDRKVTAQTALIAGLVENVTIMDQEIEQAARVLTRIYEPQLSRLTGDGSKMLAECGVRRFLEYVRAERASDRVPLSDQIIEAIATFESRHGSPPWTNKHIEVVAGIAGPWTDAGIYQETGIQTKAGKKYASASTRVDKYGYRIADDALAIKLGFH